MKKKRLKKVLAILTKIVYLIYVEGSRPDNYSFYYARTMAFQLFLERLFLLYRKLFCPFYRNKPTGFYYINILYGVGRVPYKMHNKF